MKKLSYIVLYILPLFLLMMAVLPSCKKNNESGMPPMITGIRSYVASPNDTVLHSAVANGQWVVITGQNLQNATQISFDGVPASFNNALFAPNSAVVQLPAIAFATIDTSKLYTVHYATTGGATTFAFKLGPAAPTITAISNVFAAPGDSVYLYGTNLVLVERLVYGGTTISSFKSSIDGTALGFLMPGSTPTSQIIVTTKSGTVKDTINATPTITSISDENANPGDSVYVYGTYLKNIQTLSFAGTAITAFKYSAKGNSVGFILPKLTQSGPVSVTTSFGTTTTVYNVNDGSTGVIANMEWGSLFGYGWNGGSLTSGIAAFSGITTNTSQYVDLTTSVLKGGEGGAGWPPTYEIYFSGGQQWVPTANLTDAPGNWALKFDVSIPNAWDGGTINIVTGVGGYVARWEPWQKSGTQTAAYTTNGWITVTIPLSSFKAPDPTLGDGMGAALSKITDLIGPTGNPNWTVYIKNYSSSATLTGFYGAFDNFRVVKIK